MKKIKINFCGFWPTFDSQNNFIINVLKKYYEVEIVKEPEYIFCTIFSDEYLKYNCIRIFYTGEVLSPDFNLFDYAIGFDYLDYGSRYYRFPYYMVDQQPFLDFEQSKLGLAVSKHLNIDKTAVCNRKFCSFVYSNYRADAYRKEVFEALCSYKQVDSGGRYLNNIGKSVLEKLEFEKKYKFSIAFENGQYPGYTTEKLIHAFAAQTLPIYWGDPEIAKSFNTKAFINCMEYDSIEQIMQRVMEIDKNDELYLEILRQPMLKKENEIEELQQGFEDFLRAIVEQPYQEAFRRNRAFWGERYERYMYRAAVLDYFYKKLETIYVRIREAIYKMTGKLKNKKIHENG